MNIVSISGSPSLRSRSALLLQLAQTRLEAHAHSSHLIAVRELPAQALLLADTQSTPVQRAVAQLADADLVIISTPIYKAAYSGLLKIFLDLLPMDALRGKTVLPLATGGTLAHLLALDYTLRPVVSALGARHVLDGVFATDAQLVAHTSGGYVPDDSLLERLDRALQPLLAHPVHASRPAALERAA
ncbi:NADPH-dependent FMN reductase [Pseudorhodoferax sp. Leaf267]|uniref:NADPH-dependent FMN reductase n=1 Tax=Pseudorhodoferax sp. Leaf267 TaxID=1736316 RepID=UPI0007002F6E|nr:NADPH-dependent FMN reductase [Pseudorhodoferax sp. Leaf267]KQP22722.1 NADPH-dependent FMN reductase [Pseudorhodoferax sp. Leaf267]